VHDRLLWRTYSLSRSSDHSFSATAVVPADTVAGQVVQQAEVARPIGRPAAGMAAAALVQAVAAVAAEAPAGFPEGPAVVGFVAPKIPAVVLVLAVAVVGIAAGARTVAPHILAAVAVEAPAGAAAQVVAVRRDSSPRSVDMERNLAVGRHSVAARPVPASFSSLVL
jgi:hypothetical protein